MHYFINLFIYIFLKRYVNPPPFKIDENFVLATNKIPLIFILSPGADPKNEMDNMAAYEGKGESTFKVISLGQGQETVANNAI